MHGCMTEYVFCNHPRADGRIAVICEGGGGGGGGWEEEGGGEGESL